MASNARQTFLDKTDNIEMGIFVTGVLPEVAPGSTHIRVRQTVQQNESVHPWAQTQTLWGTRNWYCQQAPWEYSDTYSY